jgi:hypothetical protein
MQRSSTPRVEKSLARTSGWQVGRGLACKGTCHSCRLCTRHSVASVQQQETTKSQTLSLHTCLTPPPAPALPGTGTAQIQGLAMHYCGQAGMDSGCFTFDATRVAPEPVANASIVGISAGGAMTSFIKQSATTRGFDSALRIEATVMAPVVADGNVVRGLA